MGGPFVVTEVFDHGVVEIWNPNTGGFLKVNGQRLKPYVKGITVGEVVESIVLMDQPYLVN